MSRLKQIMYGVTDFARMRAENAYFVDRTDFIREVLDYYRKNEFDFDVESVLRQMADWYDHYVFVRGRQNDGTPVKSVASPSSAGRLSRRPSRFL